MSNLDLLYVLLAISGLMVSVAALTIALIRR